MKEMAIVGGNRWCSIVGFPGRFRAIDIDLPEELPAFLKRVRENPDFVDLTVTNPYKQQAFEWFSAGPADVIEIAPRARGSRGALVVGAGGAARSIADALLEEGLPVTIANIVEDDAEGLSAYLQERHREGHIKTISYASLPGPGAQSPLASVDLVVLAITEGNPFPSEILRNYRRELFLVDARYGELAEGYRAARDAGLAGAGGRHMLFGQFALAADTLAGLHGVDPEAHTAALAIIRTGFLAE